MVGEPEKEGLTRDAQIVGAALRECSNAIATVLEKHGLQSDTLEGRTLMQSMGWALRGANAIEECFK